MYVRVTLGVVCGFVECYDVYGWGLWDSVCVSVHIGVSN